MELKSALLVVPVLTLPDYSIPFVIETDAIGNGIGAFLMQKDHPISFISKGLSACHATLSGYKKELLALYKNGKENLVADALSRIQGAELMSMLICLVQADLWDEIKANWTTDPLLQVLIESLQVQPRKHFTWLNPQLRRTGKLVVGDDTSLRTKILSLWNFTHVGGHSGIDATTRKVMAYFYWNGIRSDIANFVYKCVVCKRNKYDTSAYPGLLQPLPIFAFPWMDICMDFIEELL
ncbi:hypothetical protein KY290_035058 [Solanum tuberosum]|uniref:Uncharacterized protein n=1 Tax=Solanum tuberosum TaxID=4113 RepID=A0ABQ7U514_SOLTU|nr:hypothetical protein KY289_034552 [Solanum tuberosum]KAH0646383.1 hypothetical protein KY284_034267 [Solanum tuberosum]KAH0742015.1 hypothetical protein KY290_035058 [Solanum tuberosum]